MKRIVALWLSVILFTSQPCFALVIGYSRTSFIASEPAIYGYNVVGDTISTNNYGNGIFNKITVVQTKTSGTFKIYAFNGGTLGSFLPIIADSSGNVLWNNSGAAMTIGTYNSWWSVQFSGLSLFPGTYWVGFYSAVPGVIAYTKYTSGIWTSGDVKYTTNPVSDPFAVTNIFSVAISNSTSPRSIYVEM